MSMASVADWSRVFFPDQDLVALNAGAYRVQNAGKAYSLTSPAADALRFELRPGDVWAAVDPPSKERSEIAGETTFPQGVDIHVAYRWRVETGEPNDAKWLVAGQFHQTASGGLSPPFQISLFGDRMAIVIDRSGYDVESYKNYQILYIDANNIVRGRTYSIEIDANFDPVHGFLRVARDGATPAEYRGPLGYAGMGSVYWKEGVYRAAARTSITMTYAGLSVSAGGPAAPARRGLSPSSSLPRDPYGP